MYGIIKPAFRCTFGSEEGIGRHCSEAYACCWTALRSQQRPLSLTILGIRSCSRHAHSALAAASVLLSRPVALLVRQIRCLWAVGRAPPARLMQLETSNPSSLDNCVAPVAAAC